MWKLYNPKNEMKNPSGNKLEKLVFGMFDQMVEGADKYVTKQGSTWLIFTESKKWVIEFTKDKTLWFNFNLFQNELDLIGKDCVEERDLIKNWFESRFFNKPKVEETKKRRLCPSPLVEDTIQNGVKDTLSVFFQSINLVEDTIQNGVKDTQYDERSYLKWVEDTIENGVKETQTRMWPPVGAVDETIENGVKTTEWYSGNSYGEVEDTIENGVKETTPSGYLGSIEMKGKIVHQFESPKQNNEVEDTIENGVKETKENRLIRTISVISTIKNGVKETKESMLESLEQIDHQVTNYEITESINDAIENGVKEIQPLPAQDGNRDWGLYYQRQEDRTKPHTEYVKEVIEDSYNHMGRVEGVIRNTDKDGI